VSAETPAVRCPRCHRPLAAIGWLPPGYVYCQRYGGRHFYRVTGGEYENDRDPHFASSILVAGALVQTCSNLHDLTPDNAARVRGRSEPRCKRCNRERVRQHRARRPSWTRSNTTSPTGHHVLQMAVR
jgi:hypothetical protein